MTYNKDWRSFYNIINTIMKVRICVIAILLVLSVQARSFNNHNREKILDHSESSRPNNLKEETYIDFYFGTILGWQTQQTETGQCYADTIAFYTSLNSTLNILYHSYLPSYWFNLLDRFRINIDNYSNSLHSCQVHSILTKLQRILTQDGIVETAARLLTQIAILQIYFNNFTTEFAQGNLYDSGMNFGKLSSAIVGVTVN